jgi:hypothetical protein
MAVHLRVALTWIAGIVLLGILAGCGGGGSLASPAITPTVPTVRTGPDSNATAADAYLVRQKGYDVTGPVVETPDGRGQTLYAIHGTCHGSADGYCQIMLFFRDTHFLGTDTSNPSTAIMSYHADGTGRIAVTYPTYAKSDPLCCPSGHPVKITFWWNGSRFVPSGNPGSRGP